MSHRENGQLPQIATEVFLIEYVDATRVASIVKNMVSQDAIVELIVESKRLIVTDIATNIKKISEILNALDTPKSGLEIGQYVGQNASPTALTALTQQLLEPVLAGQPFVLVPHSTSNSVFVVSSPFLVEKALSIMQKIDMGENVSQIFSFDTMKFDEELAKKHHEAAKEELQSELNTNPGFTEDELLKLTDEQIRAILRDYGFTDDEIAKLNQEQRRLELTDIELGPLGSSIKQELRKKKIFESSLPIGEVESTKFYIHKLQYRRSSEVVKALKAIATSLRASGKKNNVQSDLVTTLNTLQIMEESNSIVLTGTAATLEKAKTLIAEIDVPVRQVLIEVLVLDTTITNALTFGVEWGAKLQRRNLAVEGGFFPTNTPSAISGSTDVLTGLADVTQVPVPPATPPAPHASFPASVFDLTPNDIIGPHALPAPGFTTGSIGRKVVFNGHGFFTMAGLINAIRSDQQADIIMTPKITTEHNIPAEIYVGQKVPIKGLSVANDNGNILTTSFEIRDVGVLLKVTPLISSIDNTVTLIIEQRISAISIAQANSQGNLNAAPATITESRTITRVHLPSDHFIILSGLVNETQTTQKQLIPCLGALPIFGSLFSNTVDTNEKHNLMLFLRPHIMDSDLDIDRQRRRNRISLKTNQDQ